MLDLFAILINAPAKLRGIKRNWCPSVSLSVWATPITQNGAFFSFGYYRTPIGIPMLQAVTTGQCGRMAIRSGQAYSRPKNVVSLSKKIEPRLLLDVNRKSRAAYNLSWSSISPNHWKWRNGHRRGYILGYISFRRRRVDIDVSYNKYPATTCGESIEEVAATIDTNEYWLHNQLIEYRASRSSDTGIQFPLEIPLRGASLQERSTHLHSFQGEEKLGSKKTTQLAVKIPTECCRVNVSFFSVP